MAAALSLLATSAAGAQTVPGVTDLDWGRQRAEYTSEALRALNQFVTEWTGAWKSGNPRAIARFYSLGASVAFPDGEVVRGEDGVRRYLTGKVEPGVELRTSVNDFVASEGLLSATGTFVMQREGETEPETGTYMMVVRRETGRWRIRAQAFIPPPEEVPAEAAGTTAEVEGGNR